MVTKELEILQEARAMLPTKYDFCTGMLAQDAAGQGVDPMDPRAERRCTVGALRAAAQLVLHEDNTCPCCCYDMKATITRMGRVAHTIDAYSWMMANGDLASYSDLVGYDKMMRIFDLAIAQALRELEVVEDGLVESPQRKVLVRLEDESRVLRIDDGLDRSINPVTVAAAPHRTMLRRTRRKARAALMMLNVFR